VFREDFVDERIPAAFVCHSIGVEFYLIVGPFIGDRLFADDAHARRRWRRWRSHELFERGERLCRDE
jgi:hypothetical protein